jgi:hypothetical protein
MTSTTEARITIATLKPGDVVMAGYRKFMDANEFIGFTSDDFSMFATRQDLSSITVYDSYNALKSNVADRENDKVIFCEEDGTLWAAYRWNNRWRVGTSADTLKLAAV